MATTARIHFQATGETAEDVTDLVVFKKTDGHPSTVVGELREWMAAGTDMDFVSWIEARRQESYPRKIKALRGSKIVEKTMDYERIYFSEREGLPAAVAYGTDFEYTVTLDGRIFGGREL